MFTWEDRKNNGKIGGNPLKLKPQFSFVYAWVILYDKPKEITYYIDEQVESMIDGEAVLTTAQKPVIKMVEGEFVTSHDSGFNEPLEGTMLQEVKDAINIGTKYIDTTDSKIHNYVGTTTPPDFVVLTDSNYDKATPYPMWDVASGSVITDEIEKADAEHEIAISDWKMARENAVNNIVVLVDGIKYDGDETSQSRMVRAIQSLVGSETVWWVDADNNPQEVTQTELGKALRLAGAEQSRLWNEGRPT